MTALIGNGYGVSSANAEAIKKRRFLGSFLHSNGVSLVSLHVALV